MGAAFSWGGVRPKRYSVQPDPEEQGFVVVQGRVPRGHAQKIQFKKMMVMNFSTILL